jgi:hypothetical protein
MLRYRLKQNDIKHLYSTTSLKEEGKILLTKIREQIFVDILETKNEKDNFGYDNFWALLKLYYPNGDVVVGWTPQLTHLNPLDIVDTKDRHSIDPLILYDGRFNSTPNSGTKQKVWIKWGTDLGSDADCYEFDTVEELDAFLSGVDVSNGYMDYTQYSTEEEANNDRGLFDYEEDEYDEEFNEFEEDKCCNHLSSCDKDGYCNFCGHQ